MRAAIFYLSMFPGQDRSQVIVDGQAVYVRGEICCGVADLEDALDLADPRDDETVMNSHELK